MAYDYFLHYSVILCWGLNLFFLYRSARDWHGLEPSRAAAWLAMAAVAALAVGLSALLPARGGYDNNHDFLYLGQEFFTRRPGSMLMFKEVSPLFTDAVSDLLSGYSLLAILWKNRLLQVFSIFVFFTGLRRLGAGLAAAAAATAFLFLNFLSPLNASSFSTTSANLFIWLTSLLAIVNAWAAAEAGPAALAWIMSSLVLVISARIEFLPANLLLLGGLAAAKIYSGDRSLLKPLNLAVLAAWAVPVSAWAVHSLSFNPAQQVSGSIHPLGNLLYQLVSRNLGIIAGLSPAVSAANGSLDLSSPPAGAALCLALMAAAAAGVAAGCLADKNRAWVRAGTFAALALWICYFSVIFQPMDFYPLHFMRHQLYFFLPFTLLFALALDGAERAAGSVRGGKRYFAAFCLGAAAVYFALNARTALAYNGELRTNDRELEFLAGAQRAWPRGCVMAPPVYSRSDSRADLVNKYFPRLPNCADNAGRCLMKYVSPQPFIFSDSETLPLEQAALAAGPPSSAWKTASFRHLPYTFFSGRVTETREPVLLTIGFYRLEEKGRDRAYLESVAGACAADSGNMGEAAKKFGLAAEADPSCLKCRYMLALSRAARKEGAAALKELAGAEKLHGAALPPEYRALVSDLAAGDKEKALIPFREISGKNPEFFFRKNFSRGLFEQVPAAGGGAGR